MAEPEQALAQMGAEKAGTARHQDTLTREHEDHFPEKPAGRRRRRLR
jgi:hypothetical protein